MKTQESLLTDPLLLKDPEVESAFAQKTIFWRFNPSLEKAFEDYRYARILKRVIPIGWSGLLLFFTYSILDALLFPSQVYAVTILIRLSLICPVIGLMMWCSKQNWPYRRFMPLYALAFFVSGAGIVGIILTARLEHIVLPYDGLLLMLMFGYSLMAMPFVWISAISLALCVLYVTVELKVHYPKEALLYNIAFLMTANIMGMVGSILQQNSVRTQFLHHTLIQRSRELLMQESREKTRLLASAGHDLRQPLHAMTLIAEDLEQRLPEGQEQHSVRQLQRSIKHLNQMLGSVLDISRISVGRFKMNRQPVVFTPLANELIDEFQGRALKENITLRCLGPADATLYTDHILLGRILRNLLENAYTHSGATRIILSWRKVGGHYRILISDNGAGIPADEQSRIFEEFSQAKASQSKGLGLGLTIVKQLCQQLELPLGLQSSTGQGSTFWIDAPLFDESRGNKRSREALDLRPQLPRAMTTNAASSPQSGQQVTPSKRVLLIDDEPDILQAMAQLLQRWGYEVQYCQHMTGAEKISRQWQPELIISDYHLENNQNGAQVIQVIRNTLKKQIPALIVTADNELNLAGLIDENTILAHKPLQPSRLRMMLQHLSTLH